MNSIKLNDQGMTFKMDMSRFDLLGQGQNVQIAIPLAGRLLTIDLVPTVSEFSAVWRTDDMSHLVLNIPETDIKKLQDKGRNKHGISYDINAGKICLQIDVRDFKRKK